MSSPSLTLLNAAELKLWILRRLGAPQLVVEATDEQLTDAIETARRWFAANKGLTRRGRVYINAGEQEYVLPEDVALVTEVAFTETALDLSLALTGGGWVLPEQQIPANAFGAGFTGGLYSSITQSLQYIETGKRVLGIELDWEYDAENRKLNVFPNPHTSGDAIYTYKARAFAIEQLGERDHDLVKRYALAVTKEIVGRVRSKREALGAQGAVTLDGKDLLEESREDIEKLDEAILKSGDPMLFLTG